MRQISDRELHEECGVFGVFGVPDAASLSYYGLHALQHRGQEGAGIVAVDEGPHQGQRTGDRGVRRGETGDAQGKYGHRPCALYDRRRWRHRERAAVSVPSQHGRFRTGPQRQHRQFGPVARVSGEQGQSVPVHVGQRDSGPPDQEGDPLPRSAAHLFDHRCAEHAGGGVRVPDHDRQPHLRLPGQIRPASAGHRPAGRRLCRVERNLRVRRAGCRVRARRRAGRDRDD